MQPDREACGKVITRGKSIGEETRSKRSRTLIYLFTMWISVPFLWNCTSSISWLIRKIPRPWLE
jgi:hypothetical protein